MDEYPKMTTDEMVKRLTNFAETTDRSGTPSIWRQVATRLTLYDTALQAAVEAVPQGRHNGMCRTPAACPMCRLVDALKALSSDLPSQPQRKEQGHG